MATGQVSGDVTSYKSREVAAGCCFQRARL